MKIKLNIQYSDEEKKDVEVLLETKRKIVDSLKSAHVEIDYSETSQTQLILGIDVDEKKLEYLKEILEDISLKEWSFR